MNEHAHRPVSVLLIVESEAYAQKLQQLADAYAIRISWRQSLFDLGSVGMLGGFDLLVADGDLGPVTGVEIAAYAAAFFPRLPVLLLVDGASPPAAGHPRGVAGLAARGTAPEALLARIRELTACLSAPDRGDTVADATA